MENLKIRVNSEAESKEVQELFEQPGLNKKDWSNINLPCFVCNWIDGEFSDYMISDSGLREVKEITILQLRDLVVLKRNDRRDANVSEDNCLYDLYLTESKELYFYHCGKEKWILSNLNGDDDYYKSLKPIEKKEMKEYLLKSGDGKYLLTKHESNGTIEIPEWAAAYADHKNGYGFFYDSLGKVAAFHDIVWQRAQQPEELPFIDNECYTNKSDGGFRLPKEKPCDMSKWVEIREEGSLNNQYAEIEKVRQSHRTASEIADSALKHVRERAETYDQPTGERSASKTAMAFNAITGKDITESEVWLLLQLLKDVRQWSREDYHQDSAEDCIAYAALKAESLESGK